jgi:hypothetical protein
MIHAEKHDICIVSLRIANLQYVKSSCTDSSIVPTNLTFVKTEFGESSIDCIMDIDLEKSYLENRPELRKQISYLKRVEGEENCIRTFRYRFFVHTLPQEIIPSKTKISVTINFLNFSFLNLFTNLIFFL